jgi:hypothetical protein
MFFLLLPGEQAGEAWEPSRKQNSYLSRGKLDRKGIFFFVFEELIAGCLELIHSSLKMRSC